MEKIYVKEVLEAVGGQLLGNIDPDKTCVVNGGRGRVPGQHCAGEHS